MFTGIRNLLSGYKTYLIAGLMSVIGFINVVTGDMTAVSIWEFLMSDEMRLLLEGIGLGTLRAGIAKILMAKV